VRQKGFTLIEILIAVLILGVVLTTVYASYTGAFRLIADTKTDAELYGMARASMGRMTRDLEAVVPWKGAFTFVSKSHYRQGSDFTSLSFRSASHIAFSQEETAGGVAVIDYFIEEMEETEGEYEGEGVRFALYRRESPGGESKEIGKPAPKYMLCDSIADLKYIFYDDKGDEHESWDSEGGGEREKKKAPTVIEMRLYLINDKNPKTPYPFMTRVRLPVVAAK
jgi:prepilin-type N-terminal cleavage/methylation domain-containing protein